MVKDARARQQRQSLKASVRSGPRTLQRARARGAPLPRLCTSLQRRVVFAAARARGGARPFRKLSLIIIMITNRHPVGALFVHSAPLAETSRESARRIAVTGQRRITGSRRRITGIRNPSRALVVRYAPPAKASLWHGNPSPAAARAAGLAQSRSLSPRAGRGLRLFEGLPVCNLPGHCRYVCNLPGHCRHVALGAQYCSNLPVHTASRNS